MPATRPAFPAAVTSDGMTGAQRQAALRARQVAAGLVQVTIVVPAAAAADMQTLAARMRAEPDLTIGPLVNRRTGRYATLNRRTA